MENACHFKPKAKYPIKVDEEKGNIINQQEHKRRLYKEHACHLNSLKKSH